MMIVNLPLPSQIADGQAVDAVPVMTDLNYLANQVNANAQPLGTIPTVTEWQSLGQTPTFISSTSFSVPGNLTATLLVGRRLQTINTGGTAYHIILTSAFGGGNTTVTLTNTFGALDAGLSVVNFGILAPGNVSTPAMTYIGLFDNTTRNLASGTIYQFGKTGGPFPPTQVAAPDYFSEFNTTTGTFAPVNYGIYLLAGSVLLAKNGATLTSDASLAIQVAGLGSAGPSYQYTNISSASAVMPASVSCVCFVGGGGGPNTVQFSFTAPTFTGGPVQTLLYQMSIARIR